MQNRTDSATLCFSTPQPNMKVPLNNIAIYVHKKQDMRYKCKISSDFLFVSKI